jgi:hypothetical protein
MFLGLSNAVAVIHGLVALVAVSNMRLPGDCEVLPTFWTLERKLEFAILDRRPIEDGGPVRVNLRPQFPKPVDSLWRIGCLGARRAQPSHETEILRPEGLVSLVQPVRIGQPAS